MKPSGTFCWALHPDPHKPSGPHSLSAPHLPGRASSHGAPLVRPLHDPVALGPVSIRNAVFLHLSCVLSCGHTWLTISWKNIGPWHSRGLKIFQGKRKDFSRRRKQPLERQSNELMLQLENLKPTKIVTWSKSPANDWQSRSFISDLLIGT